MSTSKVSPDSKVVALFSNVLTKKGIEDLRSEFPSDLVFDMSDDAIFKDARKKRTRRNKLIEAISRARIDYSNELKNYADDLESDVTKIFSVVVDPFEAEDQRRKEEAARIAKEREEFLNNQRTEIYGMRSFIEQSKNQNSQFIADTIESVDLIETESFDKELIHEAIDTKKDVLETLNNMYQAAKAAEAVEAEREQLRIQQEAIEAEQRKQEQARVIEQRIDNLRRDPMNYKDSPSSTIAARITQLESYTPPASDFGDRVDEVIALKADVIVELQDRLEMAQFKEEKQQRQIEAQAAVEAQQQAAQADLNAQRNAEHQAIKAEQSSSLPLEQQEHEALTEVNRMLGQDEPLLGESFKSPVFENSGPMIGYQPLRTWPSSQDRAESEELDRICDQLDLAESYIEVLEQRLNKAIAA
ncbi:hypothetical protein FQP85_22100 [Pseudoalteromonas neustonica]|uniref:DUF1351 domain-containing protein n=1 Tax=Pseudoalteromonas neustonica TaxID=1840331 RepID=A0ABY3F7F1_9GAMM|nr:hypothetical protein [Pseudoalteromonas neustonica]TVU79887.1 hypothetical protein FQP85_22100 [Pseudoalteromonas neustonica]